MTLLWLILIVGLIVILSKRASKNNKPKQTTTIKSTQPQPKKPAPIITTQVTPAVSIVSTPNKPRPITTNKSALKTESHKVTGTSFRQREIEALGKPNLEYDLTAKEISEIYEPGNKIYEYDFNVTGKLVPEPTNPHDPNAIRVEANGVHIGYIKAGSTAHIHKLINSGSITGTRVEIYGGRYKRLEETDAGRYRLYKDSTPYGAKVTLSVKP